MEKEPNFFLIRRKERCPVVLLFRNGGSTCYKSATNTMPFLDLLCCCKLQFGHLISLYSDMKIAASTYGIMGGVGEANGGDSVTMGGCRDSFTRVVND